MKRPHPASSRADGFILAATLWIVVILAIVGAYITSWVGAGLERGYVRQAKVEAFRTSEEVRATAMFWFSTRYLSQRGLEVQSGADLSIAAQRDPFSAPGRGQTFVALDDRPYRLGRSLVHLQDVRGLLNINSGDDNDWYQMLGFYGVAAQDRGPMLAKLHDYIEQGPYKRLNGAKAKDYLAAGMPPPTGMNLVTPWELRHVLDWDKVDPAGFGRSGLYEQVTTSQTAGLNLNTAPASVLALLPGANDMVIKSLIAARQKRAFINNADVEAVTQWPVPLRELGYFYLPLNSVRISITTPGDPLERVIAMHLTPASQETPWQFDYAFDVPPFADHSPRDSLEILDFPDPTHPPPSS